MPELPSSKLFAHTEEAWGAMYADIEAAQSSVYLEMYIFNKNGAPYDFADLLVRKVQAGVSVQVIVDAWASGELPRITLGTLRKGGVQVVTFYSWFRRLHRKLLIIDERVAYIGGVNFYRSSRRWEDLVLRLEEQYIVNTLVRSFRRLEHITSGDRSTRTRKNRNVSPTPLSMRLVEHVAGTNHVRTEYHKLIHEAKSEITIVTPYFMPRRSFLRDLEEASVRGVSVNVLIPQQVDQLIADRINHRYLRLLEGSGIHFFLQPHMNHGKAMIVDRKVAIVGSPNFDFLSLEVNDEIGVAFSDPDVIQKLLTQTDRWRKESYPYNHNKARRHLIDWFLFPFLAFFQMF